MVSSKAWVGGATGFLGSHLVQVLLEEEYELTLTSLHGGSMNELPVYALDVLDEDAVAASAEGCSVAFLCTGAVSRNPADAEKMHRLHVTGTKMALRGLRRAGVRRVVVASTSGTVAVGTDPKKIYTEDDPSPLQTIASWPYYRSKFYGEQEALSHSSPAFEVVVVCPSLLLGPGDLRESSTGDIRRFLERAILATPAGGIAFVDVRDAARGMLHALLSGRGGERYLLSAANMSLAALFARLERISGVPAPLMTLPQGKMIARGIFQLYDRGLKAMGGIPPVDAESVELAQHYWYCSAEKAERQLGFKARDPGETLRDTVADLVSRRVVAPREMRQPSSNF